jgi:hypothetical protein
MPRMRTILLATLALAVPIPALALTGGGGAPAQASISVSASLGGCGLAGERIVCRIDASWSEVEHADYYTVSVTRPDGGVVDQGQSPGTGTSVWVEYAGAGTYGVTVTAWGTPPGASEPHVIAREKAESVDSKISARARTREVNDSVAPGEEAAEPAVAEPGAEPGTGPAPAPGEPAAEPPCGEEPSEPEPDPASAGAAATTEAASAESATADPRIAEAETATEPAEDEPERCPE